MTGRIWLIAGPTASGKSALALKLARETGAEIVNADALQLYADLRILSARPSAEEQAKAPHHLFGTVDAADGWSVGRWLRAAVPILDDIAARGRTAIVVGGTGLYFSALTQGLAEIPQVPAELRRQAQADYDMMGELSFRGRLGAHDPAAAIRIAPGDRQRLVRAWEVFAATDTPLSDWQQSGGPARGAGAGGARGRAPPRPGRGARRAWPQAPGGRSPWSRRARRSTPAATRASRPWSRRACSTRCEPSGPGTSTRPCRR